MKTAFIVGILIGIVSLWVVKNVVMHRENIIEVSQSEADHTIEVNNSNFKMGRYAICLQDSLWKKPPLDRTIADDLSITVEIYNSENKLIKREILQSYLARFVKQDSNSDFCVITEFSGSHLLSPERKTIVRIDSHSNSTSRFKFFVKKSPIP